MSAPVMAERSSRPRPPSRPPWSSVSTRPPLRWRSRPVARREAVRATRCSSWPRPRRSPRNLSGSRIESACVFRGAPSCAAASVSTMRSRRAFRASSRLTAPAWGVAPGATARGTRPPISLEPVDLLPGMQHFRGLEAGTALTCTSRRESTRTQAPSARLLRPRQGRAWNVSLKQGSGANLCALPRTAPHRTLRRRTLPRRTLPPRMLPAST